MAMLNDVSCLYRSQAPTHQSGTTMRDYLGSGLRKNSEQNHAGQIRRETGAERRPENPLRPSFVERADKTCLP